MIIRPLKSSKASHFDPHCVPLWPFVCAKMAIAGTVKKVVSHNGHGQSGAIELASCQKRTVQLRTNNSPTT